MRRIAEACRPSDQETRVVDVGCGTGALAGFMKESGVSEENVIGVDLSPEVGDNAYTVIYRYVILRIKHFVVFLL